MSEPQLTLVQGCLDRFQAGDSSARDALLAASGERLTQFARRMLRDYPGVQRWEQTDDVLQNALLRLCRLLQDVKPATARDYYRLATLQIRRELIDLVRHYQGPQGLGANHASQAEVSTSADGIRPPSEPAESTYEPLRLSAWAEFHHQIQALPEEEREVFELTWYQGLPQAEIATLLDVSVPTVKRRWLSARLRLQDALGGEMPGQ